MRLFRRIRCKSLQLFVHTSFQPSVRQSNKSSLIAIPDSLVSDTNWSDCERFLDLAIDSYSSLRIVVHDLKDRFCARLGASRNKRIPLFGDCANMLRIQFRQRRRRLSRNSAESSRFSTVCQRLRAIKEIASEVSLLLSYYSIDFLTCEFIHSRTTIGIGRSIEARNCILWRRWSNPTLLPRWKRSKEVAVRRVRERKHARIAKPNHTRRSQHQYDQLELLSSYCLAFTSYVLSPQKVSHRKLAFPKYSSQFAHKPYRFRATEIRFVTNEPSTSARPSLAVTRNGRRSRRTCRPTAYSGSRMTAWIS